MKVSEMEKRMTWFEKFDALVEERLPELHIEKDAPMAKYTSFRIGGPAKRMAFPRSEEDAAALQEICRELELRCFVLGKGTNLLVADEGLDYLVLNMTEMNEIRVEENGKIYAQAGAQLSRIAVQAQQKGYGGFAFAHGIPGSFGGAIAMNAGAYGGEMKQVVESVTALFEDGIRTVEGDALDFGYRHSVFSEENAVILSAVIALQAAEPEEIRAEMDDLMKRRKTSQPLEFASAGSTFKRPEGHFAGTMIDQCGLKGTHVGDAEVSTKHAGFVINKGEASCEDVLALIRQVQECVKEKFDVMLEPEVKIIR